MTKKKIESPKRMSYEEYRRLDPFEKIVYSFALHNGMLEVSRPIGISFIEAYIRFAKLWKEQRDNTINPDIPYIPYALYEELSISDKMLLISWEQRGEFQIGKKLPGSKYPTAYPKIKV